MKTYKEFLEEAVAASLVKSVARSIMQRNLLRAGARSTVAAKPPAAAVAKPPVTAAAKPPTAASTGAQKVTSTTPTRITLQPKIRGFQTARGSTYTTEIKPKTFTKTQRTAADDPYHPTQPGVKQKSDWTVFMRPHDALTATYERLPKKSINDLPMQRVPRVGLSPLEVWNNYQGSGKFASHPGSPITRVFTNRPGQIKIKLSPEDKLDLKQRVRRALKNPLKRDYLMQQIRAGEASRLR